MKLASGKLSTFYFNMKPTMLDSEGAHLIATLILDQLDGVDADLIGGLEMGAVPPPPPSPPSRTRAVAPCRRFLYASRPRNTAPRARSRASAPATPWPANGW